MAKPTNPEAVAPYRSADADAVSSRHPDGPAVGDTNWARTARHRAVRLRQRAAVLEATGSLAPLVAATRRRAAELELLAAVVDDLSMVAPDRVVRAA
jgi:hypothetical protein